MTDRGCSRTAAEALRVTSVANSIGKMTWIRRRIATNSIPQELSVSPEGFPLARHWPKLPLKRVLAIAVATGAVHLGQSREAGAVTQFQKSIFTAINLRNCRKLQSQPEIEAHICPGLPGFPVYIAERGGRTFLATSDTPAEAKAASQSLASSNTPFARATQRATIEWRFVIREGRKLPYATIVRYFTRNDGNRGEVLVVSRVHGAESCHVAHIDALANTDAIVLARRIADERARTFECASPPTIGGETGASPM